MPCASMIQEFQAVQAKGQEYLVLSSEDPFVKAINIELARQGVRVVSEVRMYQKDRLTVQVEITAPLRDGTLSRTRDVVQVAIDELHDMAVKFLPPPDPTKPRTIQDILNHHHPKNPVDLSGIPLPRMRRKYVEVKTIDGYMFDEVWEAVEEKPEEEKPKEKKTRKIQLEVEVDE